MKNTIILLVFFISCENKPEKYVLHHNKGIFIELTKEKKSLFIKNNYKEYDIGFEYYQAPNSILWNRYLVFNNSIFDLIFFDTITNNIAKIIPLKTLNMSYETNYRFEIIEKNLLFIGSGSLALINSNLETICVPFESNKNFGLGRTEKWNYKIKKDSIKIIYEHDDNKLDSFNVKIGI